MEEGRKIKMEKRGVVYVRMCVCVAVGGRRGEVEEGEESRNGIC